MIDEKQLIEEVEKEYRSLCPNGEPCHYPERFGCCYDKAISKVAEIINNQPKVGEWIPCSERLPENIRTVIVHVKKIALPTFGWYGNREKRWHLLERDFLNNLDFEVVAWMPMPEPYKGE